MAKVLFRSSKRNRVQFTVSEDLYRSYQECLRKAELLHASIDFSRDFERWFAGQLEPLEKELDVLVKSQDITVAVEN